MKTKHLTAGLVALLTTLTPARAADNILHNFTGVASDGSQPYGSLTLSGAKFYGMTYQGGSSVTGGTLFTMNTDGSGFGLLHSFTRTTSDGGGPEGSLTLAGTKIYGMTSEGGSSNRGTVFSMNSDGTGFGLLHSFTGGASDGRLPIGSLTLSGTKLYGMTFSGGSVDAGSLFSMNTDGTGFGLLHSFTGGVGDGISPSGSLTLSGAKLYGMTRDGGSSNTGTVFSMNTDGTGFSLLHHFTGGASNGTQPLGSLALSGTKLYGMTFGSGSSNSGTLFSMNTNGTGFGLLHTFTGGASDGQYPYGSLTLSGTKLYGMTQNGGSGNNGTIFSMKTDGTGYSLLESFGGAPTDGAYPFYCDVTLSGDGSTLYGTTAYGGTANLGVVFSHPTPEPASAALLGLGALLLAAPRRHPRPV